MKNFFDMLHFLKTTSCLQDDQKLIASLHLDTMPVKRKRESDATFHLDFVYNINYGPLNNISKSSSYIFYKAHVTFIRQGISYSLPLDKTWFSWWFFSKTSWKVPKMVLYWVDIELSTGRVQELISGLRRVFKTPRPVSIGFWDQHWYWSSRRRACIKVGQEIRLIQVKLSWTLFQG